MSTPSFAARITGTGAAFPLRQVTNAELCQALAHQPGEVPEGFGPEWITERTGIRTRHYSEPGDPTETTSGLGYRAALQALQMAGKTAADLDGILFATCTPDQPIPSSACFLEAKLGSRTAWAYDINAACSGFQHALATAQAYIESGMARTILVVGADVLSGVTDFGDRKSSILFGDAAGAMIVERVDALSSSRILGSRMGSDGSQAEFLQIPAGGSVRPYSPDRYAEAATKLQMKGNEIFKSSVRTIGQFSSATIAACGLAPEQIRWVVPHQANLRIIEAVSKRMGIAMDRFVLNIGERGNTSAATVPTAFDQAVRAGQILTGDTVLINVFGAGITYGATVLRW